MKQISEEGIRNQQAKVLKLLGIRPVTAGQLEQRAKGKLDRYQISRRLPELERLGKVVRRGRCKCPVVGSGMTLWALDNAAISWPRTETIGDIEDE